VNSPYGFVTVELNSKWSRQFVFSQHRVNYHLLLAVSHYPGFFPLLILLCVPAWLLLMFSVVCVKNPSVCYSLLAVGPNVPSAPVRRISSQHLEIQMFIFLFIIVPQWEKKWAELQKTSPTVDRSRSFSCQMSSVVQGHICSKLSWHLAMVMLSGLLHKWLIISGETFFFWPA